MTGVSQGTHQANSGSRAQPIDCNELLSRCLGRAELMEFMLTSFRNSVDRDMEALLAAIDSGQHTETARLAHKLKGTSLTVAAHDLAEHAHLLNQKAEYAPQEETRRLTQQLRDQYAEIVRFLDGWTGPN